jgi:hypothetical protein
VRFQYGSDVKANDSQRALQAGGILADQATAAQLTAAVDRMPRGRSEATEPEYFMQEQSGVPSMPSCDFAVR